METAPTGVVHPSPPEGHLRKGWTRCKAWVAPLFTPRVRGLGVPIAITVLLALAPIILLYQQNRLVALQEQIAEGQTQLMELQTLAATSDLSRRLFEDITGVVYLIARVEAARTLYKEVRNTSISVKGRTNAPKSLFFDERAQAKNYFLDLCGNSFSAGRLRPVDWGTSQCEATNPFSLLDKIRVSDFESDPYGKTLIAWMYYLKNIADSEHFTLLGATGVDATGDPKEDSVSDIKGNTGARGV
jgi:hypothetical protein